MQLIIGSVERRLPEAASTSDLAFEMAAGGCPEGTVVVAESQTRGRGRQGRGWFSVKGGSLTCSVVLRPTRDRRFWPELPLVCAGSVAQALLSLGAEGIVIKSPNDVLAGGGRKIAGVLLENRLPGGSPLVIAGIGVNVSIRQSGFPPELRGRAVCLEETAGAKRAPEEVLAELTRCLDNLYFTWQREGAAPVRSRLERSGVSFTGFQGAAAR